MPVSSPRTAASQALLPPLDSHNEAEHRRKLAEAIRDFVGAGQFYVISAGLEGVPTAGQKIVVDYIPLHDIRLPASLSGSAARVRVNPTGAAQFSVLKNNSAIGTINVAVSGAVTFTFATPTDFLARTDYMTVKAPNPADATLADFSVSLLAQRLR